MSSKITNPQIDQLYDEALKAGALGEQTSSRREKRVLTHVLSPIMCATRWLPVWN